MKTPTQLTGMSTTTRLIINIIKLVFYCNFLGVWDSGRSSEKKNEKGHWPKPYKEPSQDFCIQ